MIRISAFASLCAALLVLAPGTSHAARPVAAVAGIITEAPSEASPHQVTIESGNEIVVLKVTRKTRVVNIPPGTPGTEPDAELLVGHRAEGTYDPNSKVAISIGVTRLPEVTPRTGILTAVGPVNTVTIDPEGPGAPEELVLQERSRLFAGTVPVSPEQLTLLIGLPVDVLQLVESTSVERLRALLPSTQSAVGVVRSVDGTTGTLRVALPSGVAEFTLPAGLEVRAVGGGTVPTAALREGDRVRVTFTSLPSEAQLALQVNLIALPLRQKSGRLIEVEVETRTLTLAGGSPNTFRVLDEALITFETVDEAPITVTPAELAALIPQYERVRVRVEYLVRGKTRIATRVQATGTRRTPPSPTSGGN